jgi:ubiquitin-activating enzyme E1
VCTLKNFPNQIQHTLQWPRDYFDFEVELRQGAEDVNSYLASSDVADELTSQDATKLDTAKTIRRCVLVDEPPTTFEDCINWDWIRLKFEDLFANQMKQLLHNLPEDQATSFGSVPSAVRRLLFLTSIPKVVMPRWETALT